MEPAIASSVALAIAAARRRVLKPGPRPAERPDGV
jgi:hypothetical protein